MVDVEGKKPMVDAEGKSHICILSVKPESLEELPTGVERKSFMEELRKLAYLWGVPSHPKPNTPVAKLSFSQPHLFPSPRQFYPKEVQPNKRQASTPDSGPSKRQVCHLFLWPSTIQHLSAISKLGKDVC